SRETYIVAPRARAPARRSASVSAWGRPPGWVQPRAITSPEASSTITAPTAGFGAVFPSPRRASLRAMSMKRPSRSDWVSLAIVLAMGLLAGAISFRDLGQNLLEVRRLAKIAVHGSKSNVSHRIEAAQGFADRLANCGGCHLRFSSAFELTDDT